MALGRADIPREIRSRLIIPGIPRVQIRESPRFSSFVKFRKLWLKVLTFQATLFGC